MIPAAHRRNLDTVIEAAQNGDLAVVECTRRSDGATVNLLCAIGFDGEMYGITPFAEMVDGNPFEMYDPPTDEGDV